MSDRVALGVCRTAGDDELSSKALDLSDRCCTTRPFVWRLDGHVSSTRSADCLTLSHMCILTPSFRSSCNFSVFCLVIHGWYPFRFGPNLEKSPIAEPGRWSVSVCGNVDVAQASGANPEAEGTPQPWPIAGIETASSTHRHRISLAQHHPFIRCRHRSLTCRCRD